MPSPPERFPDPARLADPRWQTGVERGALARGWRWLAHRSELGAAEEVSFAQPVQLDEEPLALVREGDRTRLFSNVCTHRWHPLVQQAGPARGLRCGYHGRRFALDGRCFAAPGFERVAGFPSAEDHLPELPLGDWQGHLFGALAPDRPFAELIAPLRERLDHLPWDRAVRDPSGDRAFDLDAHWSLYVENYLEGLHVPFVHKGLAGALDLAAYRTLTLPGAVMQIGVAPAGSADVFVLPAGHPDEGLRVAAWYLCLFPTTMLNVYPWGLSLNVVEPRSPGPDGRARTRVRYASFVWDAARRPAPAATAASADLDRVEQEDDAVVEAVARGARSRFARRTAYAPGWEDGVRHFHGWLET